MDNLTFAEQIRIIMRRKNMNVGLLADLLGISRQNFHQQMKRDNFREQDMKRISELLNCRIEITVKQLDE